VGRPRDRLRRWGAACAGSSARHHRHPDLCRHDALGGWLLYYTAPGRGAAAQHPSRHRKTDTCAHGGYVVTPGCPVPPGGYDLVDDRDPTELPDWLHQALTPKPPTTPAATNPSSGLVLRFGEQLDTQTVNASPAGELSPEHAARYIAKYAATKNAEEFGLGDQRITPESLPLPGVDDNVDDAAIGVIRLRSLPPQGCTT
jgi:hypothetical protein